MKLSAEKSGKNFYRLLYADIEPMKRWKKGNGRPITFGLMKAPSNNSGQNASE